MGTNFADQSLVEERRAQLIGMYVLLVLAYLRFQKVSVINRRFFLVLSPLFQGVACNLTSLTNYLDEVVWVVTNFLTVTVLENKKV